MMNRTKNRRMQRRARLTTIKKNKSLPGVVWNHRRRAVLCFLRRGSLTAEAALAAPLFFFCIITLISYLGMYRISMESTVRLQQKAESLGQTAGITGSLTDVIDLYESVPAGGIPAFPASPSVGVACRGRVTPWIGRNTENCGGAAGGAAEPLVYVTEYQSVYHTDSRCTHLDLYVEAVGAGNVSSMKNNDGRHYHACEKCSGGGPADGILYITPEGECFHYDADCSGLTRTVRLVRRSEVEELPLCSRCAAREAAEP